MGIENDDELDLMELLEILLREKKTVIITFIIVSLVALGGALFERNRSKEAVGIINIDMTKVKNFNENDLLPLGVLDKIYRRNNIEEKNKISLDKFREEFKIKGIIPKEVEEKKLQYTPNNYIVRLRVGSIDESKNLLNRYYESLRKFYSEKYEYKYSFEKIPLDILKNKKLEYTDYLGMIERDKSNLKKILGNKKEEKLNYPAYGFGYREIEIGLENLENIRIVELKNYLESTDIIRNLDNFRNQYEDRKNTLINNIESKKIEGENYKALLKNINLNEEKVVISKGVKINRKNGENNKESYYVELMDKYLKNQFEIERLSEELVSLENKNLNAKSANEEENTFIISRLSDIINRYNKIIEKSSILENRDNSIVNGTIVKLSSPVVIVGNSKAKVILGGGVILGVFLGIAMAFIKNFIGEFKKGRHQLLTVLVLCCLVGYKGYGQEILRVTYTQNGLEKGLNPDGSLFNGEFNIKNSFLKDKVKLNEEELNEISITPIIPNNIEKTVENKIINERNYIYVPSEYRVILNLSSKEMERKVKDELINNYPRFYRDYFLYKNDFNKHVDYIGTYDTYRETLEAFGNLIVGLEKEINIREKNYEYGQVREKLQEIKYTKFNRILNYLNSKNIVLNIDLEKILLSGKMDYLERKIKAYDDFEKIYKEILSKYNVPNSSITLLENGEIAMGSSSNLREEQYLNISKKALETANEKVNLIKELKITKKLYKNMRPGNKEESEVIKKSLLDLQDSVNKVMDSMRNIELRDYNKEYSGSVKVNPEKD